MRYDCEGPTGHDIELTISTEDKQFLVKYYINQKENHFVTVLGSKFGGNLETGGCWKRFASPKFGEVTLLLQNMWLSLFAGVYLHQVKDLRLTTRAT